MVKRLKDEERPVPTPSQGPFNASPLPPLESSLQFLNRQRNRRLDVARLRRLTTEALTRLGVRQWNLTFCFVGARTMASLNETHLGHPGPTDVLTFDYTEGEARNGKRETIHAKPETRNPKPGILIGEIFICVPVAVAQAGEFGTPWREEVLRYILHGCLHLCGYDDLTPAARRVMKRREDQLLRALQSPHRKGR